MPAGRPRKYADNAAKQAAYNERLREAARQAEAMRQNRVRCRKMRADDAQREAGHILNLTIHGNWSAEQRGYLDQIIRKLKNAELRIDIDLT